MLDLFSHVGIVVHDLQAAERVWTKVLGLEVVDRFEVEAEGVRSVVLSTGGGAYGETTCVELVQLIDPDDLSGAIGKRLRERGEGVFHLAFRVSNTQAAAAELSSADMKFVVLPAVAPETEERVVVHPKATNGVLLELLGGHLPKVNTGPA